MQEAKYLLESKGPSMPDCQHRSSEPPRHQMTLDKQTSICQVQTGLTVDSVSAVNSGKTHKQQNSLSSTSYTNLASVQSNPSVTSLLLCSSGVTQCRCSCYPDVIHKISPLCQELSVSCQLPSIYRGGSISWSNWWELCVLAKCLHCLHVLAIKR